MDRVNALKQEAFQKRDFDGFLISNEFNLLYLTGIPRTSCLLVTREGESTIYVYGVNYEQAKAEARGFSIELAKRGEDLMGKVVAQVKTGEVKKLAADTLSIESYCSLKKALKGETRLKIQGDIIWKLRKV